MKKLFFTLACVGFLGTSAVMASTSLFEYFGDCAQDCANEATNYYPTDFNCQANHFYACASGCDAE